MHMIKQYQTQGELIFWSFYEANHLHQPVKRLWSSTTVESDLQKALHNLRDYDKDESLKHLRESSKFRAQFDWLTGINFSRAVSLKTKKKSNIGRVMTPTLKMVVDRENEINSFVSKPFYEIDVMMEKNKNSFLGAVLVPPENKHTKFGEKIAAQKIAGNLELQAKVVSVNKKEKATKAPTLYSTLELQKDANRYFKFRATKTDSIAQDLYEQGLISYPRTSCRFIPTSLIPDILKLLTPLKVFPEFEQAMKLITKLYEAGYTPICPLLSLPEIINVSNADEFKDYVDMSEDMLRRSRILVVCGTAVDETVLTDIAIANRFHVASSTMRGVLTVDKSKKFE